MFRGSIPALITPFKNDAVDEKAFADLVERQISAGSSALVPVGTTGETSTLSHEEHRRVVELCVKTAAGRVPVIAGAGSNSTKEAITLVDHAKTVGADAALVVCPYYNKPDQAGLYAHFKAINDAIEMPIILYNVPARTVSDLLPETVAELAKLPNIIGIKDASADLSRVNAHTQRIADPSFIQLSGEDGTALGHRAHGGVGCISVTANVAPELMARMHTLVDSGEYKEACDIDLKLNALHSALFVSPSPGPAKYALSKLGLCEQSVRLPLISPDEKSRQIIDEAMKITGLC